MDRDFIRRHINEAAAGRPEVIGALSSACWPGGSADRSEPAALGWIRRWRPARTAAPLPVCSCAGGRCAVCN